MPAGSNRAQALFWMADQFGFLGDRLFDLPPDIGGEFLALCQAVGSRRERQLQRIEDYLIALLRR